jgi:hypothetical protein
VLERMYAHGMRLLRGWWWPTGPKLVFDQIATPVPEIMDDILVSSEILRSFMCLCKHTSGDDR